MKFRLLGPLEVGINPQPTIVAGPQQRALLAMLLLNAGRVVSSWDLIAELWPQRAEQVRRNTLHAQVARLRNTLLVNSRGRMPVSLYSRSSGYILDIDPDEVDVTHFNRLRRRASTLGVQDPGRAIATFRQALSLWRGAALQDAALGKRCQAAAASLDEARLHVYEQLAKLHISHEDPSRIVDDLQELVHLYPMRETLLARLMAALHGSGRRAEALHLYLEARHRFNDELGMEPGEAMRHEYLRILKDD
ncbi:MAG TPA: AfsR/SARP family transcriptional regulator [Candidatus Limnocylindrales bacterium]